MEGAPDHFFKTLSAKHRNKEGTLGDVYANIAAPYPKTKERQYNPKS